MSDSLRPYGLLPARLLCPWDSPSKNPEVGCHVLLRGIFPTQGSKLHLVQLLHCRWILYHWATRETLICCFSVTQSCLILCDSMGCSMPGFPVLQCPWVFSCPLSWWCHATISSSVVPFSHLQSFPASGSFLMNQLFLSGDQSIVVSASASFLPMNIQGWFPLGLVDLISLQSKGLSTVFSSAYILRDRKNIIVMRFVVTVITGINFKLQNKFPFCSNSVFLLMFDALYIYIDIDR